MMFRTTAPRWILAALTLMATACVPGVPEDVPWDAERFLRPNGDVLATGEDLEVADTVSGDVMLFGGSTTFRGRAGGSFVGAGGEVIVAGVVEGSVRGAGGSVIVDAAVGRNVTAAGGSVTIGDAAQIDGNAYLAGGEVRVEGTIDGHVYAGADVVVIDGEVGGDVRVEAGTLRLGPRARITGELRYRIDEEETAEIPASAEVEGGVRELEPRADPGPNVGLLVARLAAFLLAGLALSGMAPRSLARSVESMSARPAAALGAGALVFFLVPVVALVVGATLVGGPLALIVLAVYLITLYLAPVVPALWVGSAIMSDRTLTERRDVPTLFLVGGSIVAIAILLPWIGFVARAVATWIGLGAVALVIRERRAASRGASEHA
jgi:hypothetical protein